MTPQDMSTGARARRRAKRQAQQTEVTTVTTLTLLFWVAVGCALGTVVSVGLLWTGVLRMGQP